MGNKSSIDKNRITPSYISMLDDGVVACCGSIIGGRSEQEDTEIIEKLNIEGHYIYAVFDGHGGNETSKYLKENFISSFLEFSKWKIYCMLSIDEREKFDFESMFKEFFIKLDSYLFYVAESSGSTAVVVLQTPTKYICSNLGDSEAWLLNKTGITKLSTVYKITDKEEIKRIRKNGGFICDGRVCGSLALTRAFGDFRFKNSKDVEKMCVSPVPAVNVFNRNEYEGTLLIGCDGFFDVMNEESNPRSQTHIQELLYDIHKYQNDIRCLDLKLEKLKPLMTITPKAMMSCGGVAYPIATKFLQKNDYHGSDDFQIKHYDIPILESLFHGFIPNSNDKVKVKSFSNDLELRQFYIEMLMRYAVAEKSGDNITLMMVTNNSDIMMVDPLIHLYNHCAAAASIDEKLITIFKPFIEKDVITIFEPFIEKDSDIILEPIIKKDSNILFETIIEKKLDIILEPINS